MPCLQSLKEGAERTPRYRRCAREKARGSEVEDEHLSGWRYKPGAMRIDWQAGNGALRPDSRTFRTQPSSESATPRSAPALRLDSNGPGASSRNRDPLPTAIGLHPVRRAVSDSSEDKDQPLSEDRRMATSLRDRPLPSASEMIYSIRIPSSGSMGCR